MLEKIKTTQKYTQASVFLGQFRDVRAVGLLIFLTIALLITWSGTKAIQHNYELQKEISQLRQENDVSQLENNNVALQNQYYNTDQYLDLKARQDFGLGLPGEKLILIPKEVALKYVAEVPTDANVSPHPESQRPVYQRHFEAWMDFFLHRQDVTD